MSLKRNREDEMDYTQKKSKIKDKYTEISSKNMLLIIVDMIEKYNDKIINMEYKLKLVEEINNKYKEQLAEIYKYLGVNPNTCSNYMPSYIS
jgi:hypothetical protein